MINPRLPAGGRTKPPKGMAVIDRTNPVGNKVTACWLLNEGGGGRVTDLVSGISSPITLNATEANRAKWKGSPDGIPCLDFGTSIGNYAACTGLQPVSYTRGISFLGLFNYPTAGSSGANRCLVMTRSDGFNGLMMSYYSSTLTITTKGWGGWGTDTGLTPTRDRLIAVAGTQAPNGDVRIWLNNRRYSTTGTAWSVPTIREWYIGVDSYDVSRQWAGPVYMTAVLHGVLSWGEMEAWARAPFAFVVPRTTMLRRSLNSSSGAMSGTCDLSFGAGSSSAIGTGTLSGSSDLVFAAGSSTLVGSGLLAGSSALIFDDGASAIVGSGLLAGSSALIFDDGSSTLIGAGQLSGSSALTFDDGTSAIVGSGQLAGSSALIFDDGASAIVGSGLLAGSSALTFTGSGTPDIPSGSITGTAAITITPTGTAVGSGILSGSTALTFAAGSSTLAATGTLVGSSVLVFDDGSSTLIGSGRLAGSSALTFDDGSSTLAGSGLLAGSSALIFAAGSSSLRGDGALAGSSGLILAAGPSALVGSGLLAGSSDLAFAAGSSTLVGSGVLAGEAAISILVSGLASSGDDLSLYFLPAFDNDL